MAFPNYLPTTLEPKRPEPAIKTDIHVIVDVEWSKRIEFSAFPLARHRTDGPNDRPLYARHPHYGLSQIKNYLVSIAQKTKGDFFLIYMTDSFEEADGITTRLSPAFAHVAQFTKKRYETTQPTPSLAAKISPLESRP